MGWIFSLQLYFGLLMKKIIIVKGGLGNQFFQYSFSKYIESKFPNDKIYLDFSNYSHKKTKMCNANDSKEASCNFTAGRHGGE